MGKSYGFVEITGVVAAIHAVDCMCKVSQVKLETWERKLGGRLVTIVVSGDISSVKEAVEAANLQGIRKPVASGVIASPHEEIRRLVELSAERCKAGSAEAGERTAEMKKESRKPPESTEAEEEEASRKQSEVTESGEEEANRKLPEATEAGEEEAAATITEITSEGAPAKNSPKAWKGHGRGGRKPREYKSI